MKIGIDISQSVYVGTGVATYTRNLVYAFLRHHPEHKYVLFGSTLRRQEQLKEFVHSLPHKNSIILKFYSFPPTLLSLMWNNLHTPNVEVFVGDVDVFHTSDWTEPPSRLPKVTTIHDLILYKYPDTLPKRIIDTQKNKLEWVKKESNAIIVDSESTRVDAAKYLGLPAAKLHKIHLGIDESFICSKTQDIRKMRQKYHIKGEYMLCVGTREPRKNLERVIKAYKELALSGVTLVIAGNPGWGDEATALSGIRVLGYVPERDMTALYSGANCFIYPSLYEGFGLPILEAMACGVPVVTSDRGSLKEIAGNDVFLVDPENIQSILKGITQALSLSQSEREEIVKRGKKHAGKFSWQKVADETLKVYKSVLK